MSVVLLPLTSQPQTFGLTLNTMGYACRLYWCEAAACWVLDFADGATGRPLANGVPLVTGADLLEQLDYLGIGGGAQLYVTSDSAPWTDVPNFDNLFINGRIYFVVPDT